MVVKLTAMWRGLCWPALVKPLRVGEVFALAMAPGVEVLLRVVAKRDGAWCVVMTRARAPSSPELFEAQALSHHGWKRPVLGGWVTEASPLESLGVVPVRPRERARVAHPKAWRDGGDAVLPMTTWSALVALAEKQWRWDHERDAVVREDAAAQRSGLSKLAEALAEQRRPRGFFPAWVGAMPQGLIDAAEASVRDAEREVAALKGVEARHRLATLTRTLLRLGERYRHTFDDDALDDIDDVVRSLSGS